MKVARAILIGVLLWCVPAFGQVGQIPGWPPIQATTTPIITYITSPTPQTSGFSWTGVSIGSATSDRVVIVIATIIGNTSNSIGSLIVGGVTATILAANSGNHTANFYYMIIAAVAMPTGTTATITLSTTGSPISGIISVYKMRGTSGTFSPLATATAASTSPVSTSLNTRNNGAFVSGTSCSASGGCSVAYSGLTNDATTTQSNFGLGVTHLNSNMAGSTSLTVTLNTGTVFGILTAVSF